MKEVAATVSSKGQVVIPVEIRKHLGLEQGDKILFVLSDNGQIELKGVKYPTVASLRGAAGKLEHPLSWQEIRDIAREDHLKQAKLSE